MPNESAEARWVNNWKRAGPILERIAHEKLRQFSFEENWESIDALLQFGFDVSSNARPASSGLIEQQRLFAKARR